MTAPTLKEWATWRQNLRSIFPDDLLEDLQEDEPQVYFEAQTCDENIIRIKNELENSVSEQALLPSILTEGWDIPQRHREHRKNWPDMENLLKLYALGLYFKEKPMTPQAIYDSKELSQAALQASISHRHKKGIPAEQRIERAPTYLRFGLRTLDAFFNPSRIKRELDLRELNQEIRDAYSGNYYNAVKLQKSKDMALRVGRIICSRYKD